MGGTVNRRLYRQGASRRGQIEQIRCMRSMDGINRIVNRGVQDCETAGRVNGRGLGPVRPHNHQECPIPLQYRVNRLNGGAMVGTMPVVTGGSVRMGRLGKEPGTQQRNSNRTSGFPKSGFPE